MSRTAERKHRALDIRVEDLERDADHMEDGIDHLTERLDGMQRLLIGILISTTTATVFLAINIVVQTAGK